MDSKKALIIGVNGQDGAYLAQHLINNGYDVVGSSRDSENNEFHNLKKLGIYDLVKKVSLTPIDFRSVLHTIKDSKPSEIYNLSGQSSVGLSFSQPVETLESISTATINILESIRFLERDIKFYSAGSSECFGDTGNVTVDESKPFHPKSPYAIAKSTAFWEVAHYRDSYGLKACTGILSNHESPLRNRRFVTQKIISSVKLISEGRLAFLELGNINIKRDWGWAPEYIEAMWKMLQMDVFDDYIIATGETRTLKEFIKLAFEYRGLEYAKYVKADSSLLRPSDIDEQKLSPNKANKILGWRAKYGLEYIVENMSRAADEANF
ncbi:MAG: GDP-mannose 4,6-dehydratase [Campylobacterales bacterium]